MEKRYSITLLIIYILLQSCSGNLTCSDFKSGRFFIPENKELIEYTIENKDSVHNFTREHNKEINGYLIIRKEKTQIEWVNGENNGNPTYEKIEWINDCSYRLTYDEEKMELDEDQTYLNRNKGIVVEMTDFIGDCVKYKASFKSPEGQLISQNGTFCKE